MRINVFIAQATGLSRRSADKAVFDGRITINGCPAKPGDQASENDTVALDGQPVKLINRTTTIMLNKPAGYVVSRDGQGSQTIYDLLPTEHHRLKPVGRLDKDSSGLLLLTDDGQLANELTHPSHAKIKAYEITLDNPLLPEDIQKVEQGVKLEDGLSKLQITNRDGKSFTVTMNEGRNRQIRRTFAALGYKVVKLHRTNFGDYKLGNLKSGAAQAV
jgi:pseudouridine synthase